ncbi:hypothetical protein [Spartinivicinus ruber]|uniref:hypothetical protein n=1 Tax=Spartinivicinus ruber TaxID=2683272 RepID=UPI001CA3F416|nr:hypothetical protein [Spartinivicinus ruber]
MKWCSIFILLFLSGCTYVVEQTRLSTPMQVKEFNSIASKYYTRPTFAALNKKSNGSYSLIVQVDTYKSSPSGLRSLIGFGQDHANQYITYIDKYLKWEKLARSRKDQFEKKIGSASDSTGLVDLTFSFYSGNQYNHLLEIATCNLMCTDESSHHYYDVANAKHLRSLLVRLRDGKIKSTNINQIYN